MDKISLVVGNLVKKSGKLVNLDQSQKILVNQGDVFILGQSTPPHSQPKSVRFVRKGNSLQILLDESDEVALELEDFFSYEPTPKIVAVGEDGQLYEYALESGMALEGLVEEQIVNAVLSGNSLGYGQEFLAYFDAAGQKDDLYGVLPVLAMGALGVGAIIASTNKSSTVGGNDVPEPAGAPVITRIRDDEGTGAGTGPIKDGGVTDDTTPIVYGEKAQPNTTVVVYINGKVHGTTVADEFGYWDYAITPALEDGTYTVQASVKNASGQEGPLSNVWTFTVDTQAPAAEDIQFTLHDDVGKVQGQLENNAYTDDTTPTLKGTSEPNATITIYVNGKAYGTTQADAQGQWEYTMDPALGAGQYTIDVTATDAAGNESEHTGSITINVETEVSSSGSIGNRELVADEGENPGPILNKATTDDGSPIFSGTAEKNIAYVIIYDLNKDGNWVEIHRTNVNDEGNWAFRPGTDPGTTQLSGGNHSFKVVPVSKSGLAGSLDDAPVYEFTYKVVVPDAPSIVSVVGADGQAISPGYPTKDTTLTVNGTVKPGNTVTILVDGVAKGTAVADADGRWSFTLDVSDRPDGILSITAQAENALGNIETTGNWNIDLQVALPDAPSALTALDRQGDVRGEITTGTTDDPIPVLRGSGIPNTIVEIYDNGMKIGQAFVGPAVDGTGLGQWSFVPIEPLSNGEHRFTAVQIDLVGDRSAPSEPLVVVIDSPVNALVAFAAEVEMHGETRLIEDYGVTNDDTPTIKGVGEPNTRLSISVDGKLLGYADVDANGNWSFPVTQPLADATYVFSVKVVSDAPEARGFAAFGATDIPEYTGSENFTLTILKAKPKAISIDEIEDTVGVNQGPVTSVSDVKPGEDWREVVDPKDRFNDPAPYIRGSGVEPGNEVRIYNNGKLVGSVYAKADGTWEFAAENPFVGKNSYTVTVVDVVGDESDPSDPYVVYYDRSIVDSVPADVDGLELVDSEGLNGGNGGSSLSNGSSTDDTRPELRGKASTPQVNIYVDGKLVATVDVAADGTWSYTPDADLSEGEHTFTAKALTNTGIESNGSPSWTFNVDVSAPDVPQVEMVDVGPGGEIGTTTPTLKGKGGEPGNTIIIDLPNGEQVTGTVDEDGNWEITLPEGSLPPEGTAGEIKVTERDPAGNDSSTTLPVIVDMTDPDAPQVEIVGAGPGGEIATTTPTIKGKGGEPGNTIIVDLPNGEKLTGTVDENGNWEITLPEGSLPPEGEEGEIKVTERDAAGNEGSTTLPVLVDMTDPDAPQVEIVGAGPGGEIATTTPTIKGKGGEPGNEIIIDLPNGGQVTGKVDEDGNWEITLPEGSLPPEGTVGDIKVTERDPAGNEGSTTLPVIVDMTDPDAPQVEIVGAGPGGEIGTTTPTIKGKGGEPGNEIIIDLPNGEQVTGTVDENGNWEITVPEGSLPPEGEEGEIKVTERDPAGNDSSTTLPVVVDLTPPDAPQVEIVGAGPGGEIGTTTPTIKGKGGEPGNEIIIDLPNGGQVTGKVDEDGNWEVTLPEGSLPPEGEEGDIKVTERDPAGNDSPSVSLPVLVDQTPPSAPVIVSAINDNDPADQIVTPNGKGIADSTPILKGTAEKGSVVTIIDLADGGKQIGVVIADSDGNWTLAIDTALSEGLHRFQATSKDAAGNVSDPSATYAVTVDLQAPTGLDPSLANLWDNVGQITGIIKSGGVTDDTRPELRGKAQADVTEVAIYQKIDGEYVEIGRAKVDYGDWSYELTDKQALGNGDYVLAAAPVDEVGNIGPKLDFNFTVSLDKPSALPEGDLNLFDDVGLITGTIERDGITDDVRPTFSGKAGSDAKFVNIYLGDQLIKTVDVIDGAWSYDLAALGSGTYQLYAAAVSKSGVVGDKTSGWGFTVAGAAPTEPSLTAVYDNVNEDGSTISTQVNPGQLVNDKTLTLTGTAGAQGLKIILLVDGELVPNAFTTVDPSGNWTLTIPEGVLTEDGPYRLQVLAEDAAGQRSDPTGGISGGFNIILDASAPDKPAVPNAQYGDGSAIVAGSTTDDNRPKFSGKAEGSGSTIIIYDNGVEIDRIKVTSPDGSWTYYPNNTGLSDGDHRISVQEVDVAGNKSAQSDSFNFKVDASNVSLKIDGIEDNVGNVDNAVVMLGAKGGLTNDTTPTVVGRAKAGATIEIWKNGVKISGATVIKADENGVWRWEIPSDFVSQGLNNYEARTTNISGVEAKATFDLNLDSLAPNVGKITGATDNTNPITGPIGNGGGTNDPAPFLNGTAEKNGKVEIVDLLTGDVIGSVDADDKGLWSFQVPNSVGEGEHRFVIHVTDAAGNRSEASEEYVINIDLTKPADLTDVTLHDDVGQITGLVTEGMTIDDTRPLLKGSAATDVKEVIIYKVDGSKVIELARVPVNNGKWSYELTEAQALGDGVHTLRATPSDEVGNYGKDFNISFKVATKAPSALSESALDLHDDIGDIRGTIERGSSTDDTKPVYSGKANADTYLVNIYLGENLIATVPVTVDEKTGDRVWSYELELPGGPASLRAQPVSESGVVGDKTSPWDFNVIAALPSEPNITSVVDDKDEGGGSRTLNPNGLTNDDTLTVKGTAGGVGLKIILYAQLEGGTKVKVGEGVSDGNKNWSIDIPANSLKVDGSYTVTVVAQDAAGQSSTESGGFTFRFDGTAPKVQDAPKVYDSEGDKSGFITSGDTIDDETPTISGKAEPGSKVEVFDGMKSLGFATVDSEGNWTFTVQLGAGNHSISVQETDAAGNVGPRSPATNFTIDASSVEIRIDKFLDNVGEPGNATVERFDGGLTNDTTPTLVGRTNPNGIVHIWKGGERVTPIEGVLADANGNWTYTIDSKYVSQGDNKFEARTVNAASNEKTAEITIKVDSAAPDAPVITRMQDQAQPKTGIIPNGEATNDPTPEIYGTAEAFAVITISNEKGTVLGTSKADKDGNWTFKVPQLVTEGEHRFVAQATDQAGNVSAKSGEYRIILDVRGPDALDSKSIKVIDDEGLITGELKAGDYSDDQMPTVNGVDAPADAVEVVIYRKEGANFIEVARVPVSGGTWSYQFTEQTKLAEGNQTLMFAPVDKVGNIGTGTEFSFVVSLGAPPSLSEQLLQLYDDQAPAVGIINRDGSTDDTTPEFSGNAPAGAKYVRIYLDGKPVALVEVDQFSTWKYTPADLDNGLHNFVARPVSASGVEGAPTQPWYFTVNTDKPAALDLNDVFLDDDVGEIKGVIPRSGGFTDDDRPTLFGENAPPTAKFIVIYLNGQEVARAPVVDGKWKHEFARLGDGTYTVEIAQVNEVGTIGSRGGVDDKWVFTVDTKAPIDNTIVIESIDPDTGILANDFITSEHDLTFKGRLLNNLGPNEKVQISLDGGKTWIDASVEGKNWSAIGYLVEGKTTVQARVVDLAGNIGATTSKEVEVDSTSPSATQVIKISGITDDTGVAGDYQTSDNTLTVTGTLSEALVAGKEVVQVSFDGINWINAATTGLNWVAVNENSLGDGSYTLQVRVVDLAGNEGAPRAKQEVVINTSEVLENTITIVSVTEDTGVSNNDFITSDNQLTVSGKLANALGVGESIEFSLDGGLTWVAVLPSKVIGTNWSYDTVVLGSQSYELVARIVNAIGVQGAISTPQTLVVDRTGPASDALLSIESITEDTGTPGDFITSDNDLTISGKLTKELGVGEFVEVSLDGGTTWLKASLAGLNWSVGVSLNDGTYTILARTSDQAGNLGHEISRDKLIIDTKDPETNTISFTSVTPDTGDSSSDFVTNVQTLTFTGALERNLGVNEFVQVSFDGGYNWINASVAGQVWTLANQNLEAKAYDVLARIVDHAGNVGATANQSLLIDVTRPDLSNQLLITAISEDTGIASDFSTSDSTLVVSGTLSKAIVGDEMVQVSYDGITWFKATVNGLTWSADTTSLTLPNGEYTLRARVIDLAGNVGPETQKQIVVNDQNSTTNTIAITGITDDTGAGGDFITSDTDLVVRGTLAQSLAVGESVQVSTDGGKTWKLASVNGPNWTFNTGILSESEEGSPYKLVARIINNVATQLAITAVQDLIIDTTPPDITNKVYIDAITADTGRPDDFKTSDQTLVFSGHLDRVLGNNEYVEISLDNGVTWLRATREGTQWSYDYTGTELVGDKTYQIQARVIDHAGLLGSNTTRVLEVITTGKDFNGLTTSVTITTDTSAGLVKGEIFSNSTGLTNKDLITRDDNVTINGTLSAALGEYEYLQISFDNGVTWQNLAVSGGLNWSYTLDTVTSSTTKDFRLRVIDSIGNIGNNTRFEGSYKVVIDLDAPNALLMAPEVDTIVNTKTDFTFSSTKYGKVEPGTIVALISDENRSGTYQERLDQVIGFAKAGVDGSWTLTTKLPAGALNLAFMVWDEAGNQSALSKSVSVGVTDGEGVAVIEQNWGGTTDGGGAGLNNAVVTIGNNGLWSFFQSVAGTNTTGYLSANAGRVYNSIDRENYKSSYLAQPSDVATLDGYNRYVNSAVFADINRDGYTDVMSQVSSFNNAYRTAYWMQEANGTYTPKSLNQGTLNHLGGAIAYDRQGDGYLDFVLADSASDSISFIKNVNGSLTYEQAQGFLPGHPGGALAPSLSVMHEVAGVDIDNNGTIDITAHTEQEGRAGVNGFGDYSRTLSVMYNLVDGTGQTQFSQIQHHDYVFQDDGHLDLGNRAISMTYADYNGDGWLDLYLNAGSKNKVNSNESRIYLNDGTGKLLATDNAALWFGDNLAGANSLAVDWNHDGKMDIVEIPRSGQGGVRGTAVLYTNEGTNVWGANKQNLTTQEYDNLTGAVALDYDWDGSMDLILYRSAPRNSVALNTTDNSAPTVLVKNTNIAADGTSLQLRIVDGEGLNTFYGNTVRLYDSKGNLVATQQINPQTSGSGNSMGLVSFFGLSATEVYSVQLLRITNGVENHVGSFAGMQGNNQNQTVNVNWGGLTTAKSHDAYVLTVENDTDATNTKGVSGIVGTGYNDTFFGSAGNDTYTGSGGWNLVVKGEQTWSETAGLDTVDYSRSGVAIDANLMSGVAVGQGNDKLIGIEALVGTAYDDVFTDNRANNLFEGRAGNDLFILSNGGNDVLMYKVLSGMESSGNGGNGVDSVRDFRVGNIATDGNADLLDLSALLDYTGSVSFYEDEGKPKLDVSARGVLDYLSTRVEGNDTIISIDRDGKGGSYGFTDIVTLRDVQTDLETLLLNNQILI